MTAGGRIDKLEELIRADDSGNVARAVQHLGADNVRNLFSQQAAQAAPKPRRRAAPGPVPAHQGVADLNEYLEAVSNFLHEIKQRRGFAYLIEPSCEEERTVRTFFLAALRKVVKHSMDLLDEFGEDNPYVKLEHERAKIRRRFRLTEERRAAKEAV